MYINKNAYKIKTRNLNISGKHQPANDYVMVMQEGKKKGEGSNYANYKQLQDSFSDTKYRR